MNVYVGWNTTKQEALFYFYLFFCYHLLNISNANVIKFIFKGGLITRKKC